MLHYLPLLLFLLVFGATLLRGRAVRAESGIGAWAFTEARGVQRLAGLAFALSIGALFAGSALLALGRLGADPAALGAGSAIAALGALTLIAAQRQMGAAWRVGEAHLSRRFGAAYDDFRRSVPRWLLV